MRINLDDPKYYKDPMETAQDYEEFERLYQEAKDRRALEQRQRQPSRQPLPAPKRA